MGARWLFVPERNLKDLVVSYLRLQERSISALTKQLRQDGYSFHRLFVTGYLKALADVGMLREKDIPPSKVYTTSAHRELNLYELVGSRCREATKDEADQVRLAIGVLQKLFRRPIFLREIRECGAGPRQAGPPAADERARLWGARPQERGSGRDPVRPDHPTVRDGGPRPRDEADEAHGAVRELGHRDGCATRRRVTRMLPRSRTPASVGSPR